MPLEQQSTFFLVSCELVQWGHGLKNRLQQPPLSFHFIVLFMVLLCEIKIISKQHTEHYSKQEIKAVLLHSLMVKCYSWIP